MRDKKILSYYGFSIFFPLFVWLPVFYQFQKLIGFSDFQIFSLQSFYYWFFLFIEIPTGWIADRFGYRNTLIAAAVFLIISHALVIAHPSYLFFALHYLFVALARSFASGTASAYLYGLLKINGRVNEYKKVEGAARSYGLAVKVFAWFFAGALMSWHLTLPYWLSLFSGALALLFVLSFVPQRKIRIKNSNKPMAFKQAVISLYHSPFYFLLMLQGVGVFVLARICQVNLFQPFLLERGFSVGSLGVMLSVMTIFEAIGSKQSFLLSKRFKDENAVFYLTALMAVCLFFLGKTELVQTSIVWITIGFALFSLAAGLAFPIQLKLLNDFIPHEDYRATYLSIESILGRAGCAFIIGLMGEVVSQGKTGVFFQSSALCVILGVLLVNQLIRFKIKKKQPL